jgi:acyl carrier protein
MDRSEIKAKLQDILVMALGADAEKTLKDCTDDSNLTTDLGLNSVGILYVVIGIEELFSMSFGEVSFADFQTVGDVIDYIEKQVN